MAFIYRHRNVPASAAACAVVALAIYSQTHRTQPFKRENAQEPISVSLVEPPPPPAPIPPPPPPPIQPPPPSPTPPRPTPAPTPPTPTESKPVPTPSPNPIPVPKVEQPPPPPPAAPTPPPSPPPAPPAPPPPPAVDVNAVYTSRVRAYLNGIKRYPTGREADLQHPQGKVRLWFVLKRDGSLVDAGIDDSSNSILLDNEALKTVRRGTMPSFDAAFGSEETHRFTVELEFTPRS
jgi:protein TonB